MLFAGALLLEEVITSCSKEGTDAIVEAAERRFAESQQQKAAGATGWWRVSAAIIICCLLLLVRRLNFITDSIFSPLFQMREASLFALASVSDQLLEIEVSIYSSTYSFSQFGSFCEF